MLTVFVVVYATTKLGMPRQLMPNAVMYAAWLEPVSLPLFGRLADKIGRRPLYILGPVHDRIRFPLVLVDRKQERASQLHRRHDRDEFRSWYDVRSGVLLLPRTVRSAHPLRRRFFRISALGRDRRRFCADHRDRTGRIFRRHWRCVADDYCACTNHTCSRARGARDYRGIIDRIVTDGPLAVWHFHL